MSAITISGFDNSMSEGFDTTTGSLFHSSATPYSYGRALMASVGPVTGSNNVSGDTFYMGLAMRDFSGPQSGDLFILLDGSTIQVHIDVNTNSGVRRVSAYRGTGTTNLLGQSTVNSLPPAGTYGYIEFGGVIHNTAGSVEVRVDGVSILSLTGINTRASANNQATIARVNIVAGRQVDDYYLFNNSGSRNNTFAGRVRVLNQYPVSDDTTDFTPVSGSDNWAMVDDAPTSDSDTTYNSLAATAGKDLFTVTGDVPVSATVHAFKLRNVFRKDVAGTCTGRGAFNTGGGQQNGATQNPGTAYAAFNDIYDADPTDSAAWTPAKINNMKIGYERLT